MAIKTAQFKIQGMNQDNSESAFPEKFAFEIMNMRIDARQENNLLSLTNEKGNRLISNKNDTPILGNPIGYATINNYLILFTHDPQNSLDYIYRIVITNAGGSITYDVVTVFVGDMGFAENWRYRKPLETLAWYESDTIQKVYWIDGIHQPRMVNIAGDASNFPIPQSGVIHDGFDFNRKLQLEEEVEIQQGYNGQFHSGIVQYFITYYDKNGSESNIAWQSPLMYVSFDERGGSPEDIIPKSFTLKIDNIDQNYDYMRLYCVQRTSLNGEVFVRKVQDFPKGTDLYANPFTDNGIIGEAVDSTYLIYVGGEELIAGCFTQKDQVLFLGDIEESDLYIPQTWEEGEVGISDSNKKVPEDEFNAAIGKFYHHRQQFIDQDYEDTSSEGMQGNENISTFKYLETYRFGFQFQFDNGRWSNVLYVGDKKVEQHIEKQLIPIPDTDPQEYMTIYKFAMPIINLAASYLEDLPHKDKIKKVRPVCVYPQLQERNVLCQGILCPTVYNVNDRVTGKTFSYGSWFSRPMAPDDIKLEYDRSGNIIYPESLSQEYTRTNYPLNPYAVRTSDFKDKGCWAEFRHNYGLPSPKQFNGELPIQFVSNNNGGMTSPVILASSSPNEFNQLYQNGFNIDQSIFTMHSPDIEFDESIRNVAFKNAKLRIIGYVPIHANSGDIQISASSVGKYKAYKWGISSDGSTYTTEYFNDIYGTTDPDGTYSEKVGVRFNSDYGWFSLINGPYWQDRLYNPSLLLATPSSSFSVVNYYPNTEYLKYNFVVYPWQQHGSLSNGNPEDDYSILKTKSLLNLKYSRESIYFDTDIHYGDDGYWTSANEEYDGEDTGLSDVSYIDSENHFTMLKGPYGDSISYDGNMDKLLAYNKNEWNPKLATFKTGEVPSSLTSDMVGYVEADYPYLTGSFPRPDAGADAMLYVDSSNFSDLIPPITKQFTVQQYYEAYNDGPIPNHIVFTNNDIDDPVSEQPTNWKLYYYHSPLDVYTIAWRRAYLRYKVDSTQPISMKYKCSPHIVMALSNQKQFNFDSLSHIQRLQRCLPTACRRIWDSGNSQYVAQPINPISQTIYRHTAVDNFTTLKHLYFDPNFDDSTSAMTGCMQDYINQAVFYDEELDNPTIETHGFYWLAELYRDDDEISNKFGGTSEEALMSNIWHVCGKAIPISSGDRDAGIGLHCTEGDTYYQRYDNLKTLPYSEEDENQVTEIVSFMCESRINLDGRYDKQRGIDNLNYLMPETFNQINDVYSQLDNYLTQSYLPEDRPSTHLPNAIIWSGKKINGEDVDIWTQLHTENFLDLEGSNGKINALKTFRNEIYAFQDSAIAQILYNSRTALATTEGSPVQLASSGLVEGKQYLTNSIGCLNKWSICETPLGLTFNDDLNKSMMIMGDGFQNLSEKFGMSTWMFDNCSTKPWDLDFSNMVVYYDKYNKDIMYVTADVALAYSTKLGVFTSFYNYGSTPYIVNYNDIVLDIRGVSAGNDYYTELWAQNMGAYNMYYGVYSPFYVTLIVNANPVTDKVFNTVEYRMDSFNSYEEYEAGVTFDTIRAWNEYQDTNDQPVGNLSTLAPSDIKKKFRMWRLNIPRDNGNMDRIRNPWAYIQLKKTNPSYNGKVQLHDIQVHYTE